MWFNGIMSFILKSPFHGMLSANTMLVTWSGNKSGKIYSTPVNYQRIGENLVTTSLRRRTWWRSLRNNRTVDLLLAGKHVKATGRIMETDESVAGALKAFFEAAPYMTRYFNLALDENHQPLPEEIAREAPKRVVVYFSVENETHPD